MRGHKLYPTKKLAKSIDGHVDLYACRYEADNLDVDNLLDV